LGCLANILYRRAVQEASQSSNAQTAALNQISTQVQELVDRGLARNTVVEIRSPLEYTPPSSAETSPVATSSSQALMDSGLSFEEDEEEDEENEEVEEEEEREEESAGPDAQSHLEPSRPLATFPSHVANRTAFELETYTNMDDLLAKFQ
jgi:hypothetical protein